jgi:ABC-type transport system involved in multi-copper enzyme maturation permease subunit
MENDNMPWYLPVRCPVLWEEFRRRFRGGRGALVLFAYVAVLMAALIGLAWLQGAGSSPREWPDFGRLLWKFFYFGQLAAILLLSPGITAGAISTEREAKTLEHLFYTPLSTLSFVLGKFFGAIGQMVVLVLAGLPIVSVVFLYGGVSPREVLGGYALILATGLLYSALGFLASSLFARTPAAVAWAYGFAILVALVLPVALTLLFAIWGVYDMSDSSWFISTNPFFVGYDTLDRDVWPAASIMLGWTAAVLVAATLQLRHLRGLRPLVFRRVSLVVARQNSRPPVRDDAGLSDR